MKRGNDRMGGMKGKRKNGLIERVKGEKKGWIQVERISHSQWKRTVDMRK